MPVEGPSSLLHTVSFDWFDTLTNQGSGNGLRVLVGQPPHQPTPCEKNASVHFFHTSFFPKTCKIAPPTDDAPSLALLF